jgi:hypothetical protein
MFLHLKDSKDFIKELLDLINTFGKVAGLKNITQISVVFLYTNNEQD